MGTNAALSLRIIGGVIIAVIIISGLIFFLRLLNPFQQQVEDFQALEQIADFNKQYQVYNKKLMYGIDIVSVINKAASNNERYIKEYGYSDDLKNTYLMEINLTTLTDAQETMEIYRINEKSQEVRSFNFQVDFLDSSIETEIFDKLSAVGIDLSSPPNKRTDLWDNKAIIGFKAKDYTLIDESQPGKMYCDDDIYDYIILGSKGNMKKTINNSDPDGEWKKIVYYTSAYDLKSKKFRCTGMKTSDISGRIIEMSFSEI